VTDIELVWNYRAVNNPAARKKWLIYGVVFLVFVLAAGTFRYVSTGDMKRTLLATSIFVLFVIMYIQIVLGKVRQYMIDDKIRYKPFRTDLKDVKGFRVDEDAKKISLELNGFSPLAVRTLYFEDDDDLSDAVRFLKKKVKSGW